MSTIARGSETCCRASSRCNRKLSWLRSSVGDGRARVVAASVLPCHCDGCPRGWAAIYSWPNGLPLSSTGLHDHADGSGCCCLSVAPASPRRWAVTAASGWPKARGCSAPRSGMQASLYRQCEASPHTSTIGTCACRQSESAVDSAGLSLSRARALSSVCGNSAVVWRCSGSNSTTAGAAMAMVHPTYQPWMQ